MFNYWSDGPRSVVLILEDDPSVQHALIQMAELEGYTAMVASSELDGHCLLAEHCDRIALLLLDVTSSGIDAFAFRQCQLDAPRVAGIPTVMMSNRELSDAELAILQPGPRMRLLRHGAVRELDFPGQPRRDAPIATL